MALGFDIGIWNLQFELLQVCGLALQAKVFVFYRCFVFACLCVCV